MASLDLTSFASALKTLYTDQRIENMVYRDNPFLAMVQKDEQFYGDSKKIPLIYGNPQGRSAAFATAQANKTPSKLKAFFITRDDDYCLASVSNETLEASMNDKGAFLSAVTMEIDGALATASRSLATALFGSGSGAIGQVTTGATGTSITLVNSEDVVHFEVGMEVVFSTANGGGSVKTGSVTVNAVNRDSGVLTVDAQSAIDGGTGSATNDYIFVQGDYDQKVKGLLAWLPSSAPTSGDSFFTVDRSADPSRLAGIRYDGSAEPIEEALINAASRVAREGGAPDVCFMSYSKFADLEKALGSKVQYLDLKVGEIGFRGLSINGPRGMIKVIADQNCPSDRAFMLTMKHWKLESLGKAPKILNSDGLKMLRETSADAVEVRVGYYAQLSCNAPGYNANIKLS